MAFPAMIGTLPKMFRRSGEFEASIFAADCRVSNSRKLVSHVAPCTWIAFEPQPFFRISSLEALSVARFLVAASQFLASRWISSPLRDMYDKVGCQWFSTRGRGTLRRAGSA